MNLTVSFRFCGLQRGPPIYVSSGLEALAMGQGKEACPIGETEPVGELLRRAEELVPVIVVRRVGRQKRIQALVKLLLVPHVRVYIYRVVPFVEHDVVNWTYNL
jgi:hypothetical protein